MTNNLKHIIMPDGTKLDLPTGVNNVYSYGMSQYYKGVMNNNSWLRSWGQWNSGAVYTGIYSWIVENTNHLVYDSSKFIIYGDLTVTDSGVASNFSDEDFVQTTRISYGSAGLESIAFDITFTPNETQTSTTIFDSSAGWKLVYVDDNNLQATSDDGYTYTVETTESMVGKVCKANVYSNIMGQGVKVTVGTTEYTGDEQSEMVSPMGADTLRVGIDIDNSDSSVFKGSIDLSSIKVTANDTTKFSVDIIRQAVDGFKLSTEEYTDYDWVLNTEDETFRLPLRAYRTVVTTYIDGTDWYTLYSDGWCEQGGVATMASDTTKAITFLVPYKEAIYNVALGDGGNSVTKVYTSGYTATGFSITRKNLSSSSASNQACFWRASGYTNIPTNAGYNLYYYIGDVLQNADLINIARMQEELVDIKSQPHIEEVYVNGTSGYRIWSKDSTGYRYCEQWGIITQTNTTNVYTITFLKAFKDTNYITNVTGGYGALTTDGANYVNKKTTSNCQFVSVKNALYTTDWSVAGYISD